MSTRRITSFPLALAVCAGALLAAIPLFAQPAASERVKWLRAESPEASDHRAVHLEFVQGGKQLLAGVSNDQAQVWRLSNRRLLRTIELDTRRGMHCTPDGWLVGGVAWKGDYALYEVSSGDRLAAGEIEADQVIAAAFPPEFDRVAYGTREGKVIIRRVASGEVKREWTAYPGGFVVGLAFSPDGRLLATTGRMAKNSSSARITLWDAATGRRRDVLEQQDSVENRRSTYRSGSRFTPLWSSDGRRIAACDARARLRVWEVEEKRQIASIQVDEKTPFCFSPDGRAIAYAKADQVTLLELASGEPYLQLPAASEKAFDNDDDGRERNLDIDSVRSLAIAPSGRRIACGAEGGIALCTLAPRRSVGASGGVALTGERGDQLWRRLASADARAAYEAMWRLSQGGERAARFLGQRLRAEADPVTAERIESWIAKLDADAFAVRNKATEQLILAGADAIPHVKKALRSHSSVEANLRLRRILATLEPAGNGGPGLRQRRVVQVLEWIADPAAATALEEVAGEGAFAPARDDAQAALARLKRRSSP